MNRIVVITISVILMTISLTLILYNPLIPILAPKICVGEENEIQEGNCGIFIRSECLSNYNQRYVTKEQQKLLEEKGGAVGGLIAGVIPTIDKLQDVVFNNNNKEICTLDKVHKHHRKFKTYSKVIISMNSLIFFISIGLLIYGIRMKH